MQSSTKSRLKAILFWGLLALLPACEEVCGKHNSLIFGVDDKPWIKLQPATQSVALLPGGIVQVPVVTRSNAVSGTVHLALGGTLPAGLSATITPADVFDNTTSTLTLIADSTTTDGRFSFSITGGASSYIPLLTDVTMDGDVQVPFTLLTPASQTATVGSTIEFPIVVDRKSQFTAPVALSVDTASVPDGTVATFTPVGGGDRTYMLRLAIHRDAPRRNFNARITARYGATRQQAVFNLTTQSAPVPPAITLAASPASQTAAPGQSTTYTLSLGKNEGTIGLGSFNLSVSGLPAGATATFDPTIPQVNSQLTITTLPATVDSTYPLTITARLGTLVQTAVVNLVVATPPNFTLAVAPTPVTINRGFTGEITATVTRTGPRGDIVIDAPSLPQGVSLVATPSTLSPTTSSSRLIISVGANANPGSYPITIRAVGSSLTRTAIDSLIIPAPPPSDVTIAVFPNSSTVARGGTIQIPVRLTRTGTAVGALLELRSTGVPNNGNAWITPSFTTGDSAILNVIGGDVGTYNVAVSAVRGAFPPTDIAAITVTASSSGDFSLLPAPQTLDVPTGTPTTAALQIGRTNGFTGPVSFTAISERASDYQVTFSLNSTTGSGIGMTIIVTTNVPLGPHVLRIRGTSGNIVHEVSMTLNVTTPTYTYPYYPFGVKRPPE